MSCPWCFKQQLFYLVRHLLCAVFALRLACHHCVLCCALQVIGGGLRDSFLVEGVAFKKTFSYAGFEQQPKAFDSEWHAHSALQMG